MNPSTEPTTSNSETLVFPLTDPEGFRRRALAWAEQWSLICYLDSNQDRHTRYQSYEALLAVGESRELIVDRPEGAFEKLRKFHDEADGWLFGFMGYDLKNDVERLRSANFDGIGMPELHFFQPEIVFEFNLHSVRISAPAAWAERTYREILRYEIDLPVLRYGNRPLRARVAREEYLDVVNRIREHIAAGDIYEMNYCQEFFHDDYETNPLFLFFQLNAVAAAPFSAFYRLRDRYLLCASPERFLKKEGTRLISMPIKGTAPRSQDRTEDIRLRDALFHSEKDRAENVMIVDLVRNDLAKSSYPGSVRVEELFGIYSFPQVHQMISTVSGVLRPEVHPVDALRRAFPMGSMTGAPKVMAMELIERYEATKRGLYSGAVGYISPGGDFDFNVVIRSLLYHQSNGYLSSHVGGAIVYDSVAEREYEECQVKLRTVQSVV